MIVPTVAEPTHDACSSFAQMMQRIVTDNVICQGCNKAASGQVSQCGPVKALCGECLEEEQKRFDWYFKESLNYSCTYE